jgi:hypothetical protein
MEEQKENLKIGPTGISQFGGSKIKPNVSVWG